MLRDICLHKTIINDAVTELHRCTARQASAEESGKSQAKRRKSWTETWSAEGQARVTHG